ncbi:MAG: helix-turn-helix transcriptional regulator, partial [Actinoplanes sp.]
AYAEQIAALPEPTRRLLLHLAAASPPTEAHTVAVAAGLAAAPGPATTGGPAAPDRLGPDCWQPAVAAGIVVRSERCAGFVHPLAAEAAYQPASARDRREAHLNLAAGLHAVPERQARHLAAATSGPDELIAADLERAAGIFRERDDLFEATVAMSEAAARSPRPTDAARRYARAATDAQNLGETDWTPELYATVRRLTTDPDVITLAAHAAGTALTRSGRQHEAYGMVTAARRAGAPADPRIAASLVALAAVIAAITGDEEHRAVLAPMSAAAGPMPDPVAEAFVRTVVDPSSHPGRSICDAAAPPPPGAALTIAGRHRLNIIGTLASYEDRPRLTAALLRATADDSPPGIDSIPMLVSAFIDTGQWDLAERYADGAGTAARPVAAANLDALRAQLHAMRGDTAQAWRLARQTWARIDVEQNRAVHLRLLRAAALAATGDGDYETAYRYLRSMFDRDGRPAHPFLARRSVAELAAAAVRSARPDDPRLIVDRDRADDTRLVVDRVRADGGAEPTTRLRLQLHLAEALLTADEHGFRAATTDPAAAEWPYELALARLHHGEWLRRARRPRDARVELAAAAATFDRLGATPAARLAARELAAGTGVTSGPLTPQEQQVASLAARGLRNREIAEQLFLSVRTVGAHLHKVYPKLGISGRRQLADVFGRD